MNQARLAVRLPNHLGDACMALPALELLAARCNPLTLVGKPWAAALFEGHGWPVVALRGDNTEQRTQLREAFVAGTPMLLLTNSFSTAMDARLARLKPIGFATDGRGLMLHRAIPVAPYAELHMVAYYRALAATLTGATERLPVRINLRVSEAARARALDLLAAAGVATPFVVLCPVAIGLHYGKVKSWDGFGRLATELQASGQRVVAMPGSGRDGCRACRRAGRRRSCPRATSARSPPCSRRRRWWSPTTAAPATWPQRSTCH